MFLVLVLIVLVLDRITKIIVLATLKPVGEAPFLGRLLEFTYVENTGAAFNSFSGNKFFLVGLTVFLMAGLIVYYYISRKNISKGEAASLALIIGGGLGNLSDRFLYGYVVDFLNIHILPVFNVADIAICTGCALLIIFVVLFPEKNDGKQ